MWCPRGSSCKKAWILGSVTTTTTAAATTTTMTTATNTTSCCSTKCTCLHYQYCEFLLFAPNDPPGKSPELQASLALAGLDWDCRRQGQCLSQFADNCAASELMHHVAHWTQRSWQLTRPEDVGARDEA